jgi:hypothetical protein
MSAARAESDAVLRECGAIEWLGERREDGQLVLRVGRTARGRIAELSGVATLVVSGRGRERASLSMHRPLDAVAEERLHRGIVEGLLRHLEGKLTVHGAAAAIGDRAVLVLGESGAGKSTTVAELCERRGAEMLADDVAALDFHDGRPVITPTEAVHWLLEDARCHLGGLADDGGKLPQRARRAAGASVPLVAICSLVFDPAASASRIVPLAPAAAIERVLKGVVRFALDDRDAHVRELDALMNLCSHVPAFDLVRPRAAREIERSGDLVERILRATEVEGAR